MEKQNDTMTICTLAKPNTVTISADDYKELIKAQEQYETMVNMIAHSMCLDCEGRPHIDYKGVDFILGTFDLLEHEAYAWRLKQLKHEKLEDSEV